jgi:hypothetical protein
VDEIERGADRLVDAGVGGEVTDAEPERDGGMPRDGAPRGGEVAVNVA